MIHTQRHYSRPSQPRDGVFISYARSDGEAFAHRLRRQLEKQQLKLWQDRVRLEGGRDWWLQITEALDNVQFMTLVVTPNALKSEIVRKEWRYARQQGVCVYPIKGAPNLDFNSLPRWMRDQHFYDLGTLAGDDCGPEWPKFLNDLNKTPDVRRVPFMVEDLPTGFVERPNEFAQLIALLLDENRADPVAITAALRGAGGYGKTTIAKALCHDERIQDAFDDGILWVTLGENPGDPTGRVEDLIQTLSGERPGFSNTEAAIARLKELLADRDLLIVIDDVWNRDHLRPFMQGGPRSARLITTRNPHTLPDRAAEVKVDAMREAEAVALLSAESQYHDREAVDAALKSLAARLGEWPLLLRLANGVLRNRVKSGETLPKAIVYANRALDKRGLKAFDDRNPLERNQAAEMTLRVSLDQLTAADRAHFSQLAIFPEDVPAPLPTLEKYWALDDLDTDDFCDRLDQCSLLHSFDLGARTIRLHDVIRTFLRDERKADLPALNNQLLDAHRPTAGWAEMPDDEPYLWDHLADHLIEAGRGEELVATVKDWRYLGRKTWLRKSHSVERDLLLAEKISANDEQLHLLRRNFANSSHLFNRCESKNDVEVTLFSRLQHLELLQPILRNLKPNLQQPYVVPLKALPDLPHPALIRTLEGPSDTDRLACCTISSDGKLAVSAHRIWWSFLPPKTTWVILWDVLTGELLSSITVHDPISSCAISRDNREVYLASEDKDIFIWNIETGLLQSESAVPHGSASCRELSDDGMLAISAADDNTAKLWDGRTRPLLPIPEEHIGRVYRCAVSANGKLVVSTSEDNAVRLWDSQTGQLLHTLKGHSDRVRGCAVSADGKLIASASHDNTIRLWDGTTGLPLQVLQGHSKQVNDCALSADGKLLVSASDDNTVKLWDSQTEELLHVLEGHSWGVNSCAISADGRLIVSASGDGTTKLWDKQNGQVLQTLDESDGEAQLSVYECHVSADGNLVVTLIEIEVVLLWDGQTGKMLRILDGNTRLVEGCALSSDGKLVVTASGNKALRVWDSQTGKCIAAFHTDGTLNCCAIHEQSGLIVAGGERGLYFLRLVR